jgi:predicted DCC family thiol-disulfide oxidoreductase YuxK
MQAICFYVTLTYTFIGLARLMTSGVKHLFDQSMVYYALYHSHRWNYWEMDMASDLLNQKWLQIFLIASFPLATLLEIAAPAAVFIRKLTVPIVLGLIVFHLAIFGFMNLLFWQNMLLLCLLLVPFFAATERATVTDPTRIVFYDGVCGLCNRFVKWVARWDDRGLVKFAPIQGQTAQDIPEIQQMGKPEEWSIYFAEGSQLYKKSEAVLRICLVIPLFADFAKVLLAIPSSVRDLVYEAIARKRYLIFGKAAACELPTKDMQSRVLP